MAAVRVMVLAPSSAYFRLAQRDGAGSLAPGMADTVELDFFPDEHRVYLDEVKIVCGAEAFVVPVQAYPALESQRPIPARIDVGSCVLGQTVTRHVRVRGSPDASFQFRLVPVDVVDAAELHVFPLEGDLVAGEEALVTVTYSPISLRTVSARFRVEISQFDFKPYEIAVVASCGAAKPPPAKAPRVVVLGTHDDSGSGGGGEEANNNNNNNNATTTITTKNTAGSKSARSAAHQTSSQTRGSKTARSVVEEVTGRSLKGGVLTQGGVNSLLLHDEARKTYREQYRAFQETVREIRSKTSTEVDPLYALLDEPHTAKEIRFKHALKLGLEREKAKDVRTAPAPGEPLPTVSQLRDMVRAARAVEDAGRAESLARAAGQLEHVFAKRVVRRLGDNGLRALNYGDGQTPTPTFEDLGKQSLQSKVELFRKFQRMWHTALVRRRAAARLKKIKALLDSVGWDKAQLRRLVERQALVEPTAALDARDHPVSLSATLALARPEAATVAVPPGMLLPRLLPVCRDDTHDRFAPLPAVPPRLPMFKDVDLEPLRVPLVHQVRGHAPAPLARPGDHLPPEATRRLRTGAEEEQLALAAVGSLAAAAAAIGPAPTPEFVLHRAPEVPATHFFEARVRAAASARAAVPTELDFALPLRRPEGAAQLAARAARAADLAAESAAAMAPLLSEVFLPHRDHHTEAFSLAAIPAWIDPAPAVATAPAARSSSSKPTPAARSSSPTPGGKGSKRAAGGKAQPNPSSPDAQQPTSLFEDSDDSDLESIPLPPRPKPEPAPQASSPAGAAATSSKMSLREDLIAEINEKERQRRAERAQKMTDARRQANKAIKGKETFKRI